MKYLTTILILFFTCTAFAHGDLDARIRKVTRQIEKTPDNPELYLKRGQLYHQHEEYMNAIVDFEHAQALGVKSVELDLLFAHAYHKADKHPIALEYLDRILEVDPDLVVANRLKGEILTDLRQYEIATQALEHALKFSHKKLPEHYVDLADAYLAIQSSVAQQNAINTLESGIQELGDLVVFLNRLVDIYKNQGDYSNAIDMQSRVIDISNRKEIPYLERAKLYILSQNITAAKTDLQNARRAVDLLPRRLLNSDHMIKLAEEINVLEDEINE